MSENFEIPDWIRDSEPDTEADKEIRKVLIQVSSNLEGEELLCYASLCIKSEWIASASTLYLYNLFELLKSRNSIPKPSLREAQFGVQALLNYHLFRNHKGDEESPIVRAMLSENRSAASMARSMPQIGTTSPNPAAVIHDTQQTSPRNNDSRDDAFCTWTRRLHRLSGFS